MYHKIGLAPGSFPVFDKIVANGPGTLEAFAILKSKAKGYNEGNNIAWVMPSLASHHPP